MNDKIVCSTNEYGFKEMSVTTPVGGNVTVVNSGNLKGYIAFMNPYGMGYSKNMRWEDEFDYLCDIDSIKWLEEDTKAELKKFIREVCSNA